MIRKRQRNQPAPCYPTLNPAKHESIPQRLVRSRRCITDRLVAVSATKCVEPRGGVEHRRERMPAQKFFPPRVLDRRNLVDGSQPFRPDKRRQSKRTADWLWMKTKRHSFPSHAFRLFFTVPKIHRTIRRSADCVKNRRIVGRARLWR